MRKTILAMTLLLAGLSTNANAEFVDGDYLKVNDSNVMMDTTTGLEWLSLTLTVDKSINNVSDLLDSGSYSGFRLATEDEVVLMFDQFLTEDKSAWSSRGVRNDFIEFFEGAIFPDITLSYGYVEGSDGFVSMYGGRTQDLIVFRNYDMASRDTHSRFYGVFLVSDSGASYSSINDSDYNNLRLENATSVPAPFVLSLFSMFALACKRKRIKETVI